MVNAIRPVVCIHLKHQQTFIMKTISFGRLRTTATSLAVVIFAAICTPTESTKAQTVPTDSLLNMCASAALEGDGSVAEQAASAAEKELRTAASASPRDWRPLVLMARVQLQCRLPLAAGAQQGMIFGDAVEKLQTAIAMDTSAWNPRYMLALSLSRAPKFLGMDGQAIAQLEWLLAHVGQRADIPEVSNMYVVLGDLHLRNGRDEIAAAVWRLGRSRFPTDTALIRRSPPERQIDSTATQAPSTASLSSVMISAEAPGRRDSRTGRAMSSLEVVTTPGGTADLLQAMQLLPGVSHSSESSDLVLRGGDPVESPVYVDGARMTYASKFETLNGGMFGVLDPSVIRRARLENGGFSARYGDALSGVLAVETIGHPDGSTTQLHANVTGGGATLTRDGRRSGLWGTIRATNTGLLLLAQGRDNEFVRVPTSIDAMAGATRRIGQVESRVVSLMEMDRSGRTVDAGGYRGPYDAEGLTALLLASVTGRGGVGALNRLTNWTVTASANGRRSEVMFGALDRSRSDGRLSVRAESRWIAGATSLLDVGFEAAGIRETASGRVPVTPIYAPDAPSAALVDQDRGSGSVGMWSEMQWSATPSVIITAGLRADRLPGENEVSIDPRGSLSWTHASWNATLGGGIFHQGRWRARDDRPDRGPDFGVAREARHLVGSLERSGAYTFRLDGFLKSYRNMVARDTQSGLSALADKFDVTGVDVLMRSPQTGSLTWWATYSWMNSRTRLRTGRSIPSSLDVTHSLAVVSKLSLPRNWELGTTLRLATGQPYTPIVGGERLTEEVVPVYGPLSSARYPNYGRVDARLTRMLSTRKGLFAFYLEALNLTGRRNVAGYTYDRSFNSRMIVPHFFDRLTIVPGIEARF